MRFNLFIMMLPIVLLISCGTEREPAPTQIDFYTDFTTASKQAAESGIPMIIDFYTDWCKWCDSLDANTYTDSLIIAMSADNIFVKINAEVDTGLANELGISGYPTIVITKPDGEEIDRIWGYLAPTDFYNQIQLYLQGKETLEDYLARIKDEPDNPEYLSIIAEKYTSRRKFTEALEQYNKIIKLDPENEDGHKIKALESMYDAKGRAKDYDGAIQTCRQIVREFPETEYSENAKSMIAYYTGKKGDKEGALGLYREYLKEYPDSDNAVWIKKRVADLEDAE